MSEPAPPPFLRLGPGHAATPLVCAVPHAGRYYPPALLANSAVPRGVLEQLADAHADRLVTPIVREGAVAIVATHARAWIDLNRAPDELDPAMAGPAAAARMPPGARVRSGLGLIPRRLGRADLLRRSPAAEDVAGRLASVFHPYHQAIAAALAEAVGTHGFAILIDCHSMPSPAREGAQIVIGDRHGRSAARGVTDTVMRCADASTLRAALNAPYAGAHTLDRHGHPAEDIHAVQVEFDRALYLDAALHPRNDQLAQLGDLLARLGKAASEAARPPAALAAE